MLFLEIPALFDDKECEALRISVIDSLIDQGIQSDQTFSDYDRSRTRNNALADVLAKRLRHFVDDEKKYCVEHNTFSPSGAVGGAHTTVGCKIVVDKFCALCPTALVTNNSFGRSLPVRAQRQLQKDAVFFFVTCILSFTTLDIERQVSSTGIQMDQFTTTMRAVLLPSCYISMMTKKN